MLVLAIDPGTKTMGYAAMEVNEDTGDVDIVYAECHNAEKMIHRYPVLVREYDELTARLEAHRDDLFRLLTWLQPDVVVAESPFFNPRRPTSGEPLVRLKQILIETCMRYQVDLYWIAPQQMKRAVGAQVRNSSKDNVREAISGLLCMEKIRFSPLCQQQRLDDVVEHTVDAIGVGYAFALETFF